MTFQTRVPLVIAAIAATLGADEWFIHRPEPHGVAEFNPVKARLGKEELILGNPALSGDSLLSHQGGKNEVVEIFFERGVLSRATQKLLKGQPWAQSQQGQPISYTTLDSAGASGPPCRTFVDMKPAGGTASEVHLFQDGIPGGENHREFSVRVVGSGVQVNFETAADDPGQLNQPGCSKLLQAGGNQIGLGGMIPVSVLAEAGSSVRLKFMPGSSTAIWDDGKGFFEPFQALTLGARSARLSPIDSQQKLFLASAAGGQQALSVDGLLVGSDTVEMRLSGVGWVTVNGRLISPTFGEWVSASSLRAGTVAVVNLAILCGVIVLGAGSLRTVGRLALWATGGSGIHVPDTARGLVVFLCHCSEDKPTVRVMDRMLKAEGFQPWLDEDDIMPARLWDKEIKRGLRSSHAVIVCVSQTLARKEGFVQKELRFAIGLADEKPDGALFLIPVRLEECAMPPSLEELQYIDLFRPDGYDRLRRVLRDRARQVGMEPTATASGAVAGG
jgi:hypothetical protein